MVGRCSEDEILSRFVFELGKLNSTPGSVVKAMFTDKCIPNYDLSFLGSSGILRSGGLIQAFKSLKMQILILVEGMSQIGTSQSGALLPKSIGW